MDGLSSLLEWADKITAAFGKMRDHIILAAPAIGCYGKPHPLAAFGKPDYERIGSDGSDCHI